MQAHYQHACRLGQRTGAALSVVLFDSPQEDPRTRFGFAARLPAGVPLHFALQCINGGPPCEETCAPQPAVLMQCPFPLSALDSASHLWARVQNASRLYRDAAGECTQQCPQKASRDFLRRRDFAILTVLDVLLGVLAAAFLVTNRDLVVRTAVSWLTWLYRRPLSAVVRWLMGRPIGLKMSYELDGFLGGLCLTAFRLWAELIGTEPAAAVLGTVLCVCAVVACVGGLSCAALAVCDLLAVLTLPLRGLYYVVARLYSTQLSMCTSLWRRFVGRKYNPLRKRVDTSAFELDVLLLGTVTFTIPCLLLPTVTAYYVFLSLAIASTCLVRLCTLTLVELLLSLPLYSAVHRLLCSAVIPGDVAVEPLGKRDGAIYFVLRSVPCSASSLLFTGLADAARQVAAQYPPRAVLGTFLHGV
eukprot:TRINITY_DN1366_c0_g1_i2.p1 TRINITY_DN1366_c0_g1~~TRINITY_DN1366_c0_g1_i2.p1  ORF type:complete len:416 (+),score=73.97 TRINITY_DN1366_c0_g1_i2:417-1664(+)